MKRALTHEGVHFAPIGDFTIATRKRMCYNTFEREVYMSLRRMISLLLIAMLMVGLMSCGQSEEAKGGKNDVLSFSVPGTVTGQYNPFYAKQAGDREILAAMTLRYFSTPGAATLQTQENEDGGISVTVTVGKDHGCTGGSTVTVNDFLYGVYLVCDPSYDGPYTALSQSSLVGLADFRSEKTDEIAGIAQIDAFSCQLHFAQSEPFETLLDLPMVYTGNYDRYSYGNCASQDITTKYTAVIGPGPYMMNKLLARDNKMVNLVPNERYIGGAPSEKNVTLRHVREQDVGLNMKMGQLSAGFLYDQEEAKRQAAEYGFRAVMLADGAFLCRSDAAFIDSITKDMTITQAITVLLASL